MRKINKIIIHCSATRPSMDIGKKEIEDWHLAQGWSGVGYHFVIRRDGTLELGRDVSVTGAHCKGHNKGSLGICLVGGVTEHDINIAENNFTAEQFTELERLIAELIKAYAGIKKIYGHNNFVNKACPCFDVREWLESKNLHVYA